MSSLQEIFNRIGHFGADVGHNDKGSIHSYIESYERLLKPYRDNSTIMEIGLAMGESIKLWDEYFRRSRIIGIDISLVFDVSIFQSPSKRWNQIMLFEQDATKPMNLSPITDDIKFDIIIDDASHQTEDQIKTFNLLKHKMNKGGLYIIEDILALDIERNRFLSLHSPCEIIDLRHVKNRFDDCLIVYKF